MEEENDPIICFQHCTDTNILCLRLPDRCPICNESLAFSSMKIPPFRLPTPFEHSRNKPFTLVVRPTTGNFLDSASSILTDDLHVGITDSKGVVYDFDEDGINRCCEGWSQCLAVHIVKKGDYTITSLWNNKLQEFMSSDRWLPEKYDEENHNCFSFALEFLCYVGLEEKHLCLKDKIAFCKEMLLPKCKEASKYVQVYEKICIEAGVFVEKTVIDTPL